jgi:hypothetical protein
MDGHGRAEGTGQAGPGMDGHGCAEAFTMILICFIMCFDWFFNDFD